jgi:cell division septum initiation protein DivIVA
MADDNGQYEDHELEQEMDQGESGNHQYLQQELQHQQQLRDYLSEYAHFIAAKKAAAAASSGSSSTKKYTSDKKSALDAIQLWMIKRGNLNCRIEVLPALVRYTTFKFSYEYPVKTMTEISAYMTNPAHQDKIVMQLQRHAYVLETAHAESETIRPSISLANFMARTLFDHVADLSAVLKTSFKIEKSAPSTAGYYDIEGAMEDDEEDFGPPPAKVNGDNNDTFSQARQLIRNLRLQNLEQEVIHAFTDPVHFKPKDTMKLMQRYDCQMPVEFSAVAKTPIPLILKQYLLVAARASIDEKKSKNIASASGMNGHVLPPNIFDATAAIPPHEMAMDLITIGEGDLSADLQWLKRKVTQYCTIEDTIERIKAEAKAVASAKKIDPDHITRAAVATPNSADAHLYWEAKSKDKELAKELKQLATEQLKAAAPEHLAKNNQETQARSVMRKLDPSIASGAGGFQAEASFKGSPAKVDDKVTWAKLAQCLVEVCDAAVPAGPFISSEHAMQILEHCMVRISSGLTLAMNATCAEDAMTVDTDLKITIPKEAKSEKIYRRRGNR